MSYAIGSIVLLFLVFFNDSATTEIYTLSLHDALPIFSTALWADDADRRVEREGRCGLVRRGIRVGKASTDDAARTRSAEYTSELQSRENLVCRLLLEKKKKKNQKIYKHQLQSNNYRYE